MGDAVAVGVGVGVSVGSAVAVAVGVGVGLSVGVAVGVAVGELPEFIGVEASRSSKSTELSSVSWPIL